jgi:hypothetical protein
VLLGDLPTLIITACASVSLPQPQRPLSRQALQGAVCLVPSLLARPSAVQLTAGLIPRRRAAVRGAMRVQVIDGGCMAACPLFCEGEISSQCLMIVFFVEKVVVVGPHRAAHGMRVAGACGYRKRLLISFIGAPPDK